MVIYRHLSGRSEENRLKSQSAQRSQERDLKPALPEHEAGEVNRFNAVQSGRKLLMFRRNLKPETSLSKKIYFFYLEARGSLLLRNTGTSLLDNLTPHPIRRAVLRRAFAGFPQ